MRMRNRLVGRVVGVMHTLSLTNAMLNKLQPQTLLLFFIEQTALEIERHPQ